MLQYPSHRPVPRMVLASTLEKLSDNPRYLAAVLLDSSRPWNDRLDELHDAGIPVSRTRARNLASCMRRFGVRTSDGIVQNANAYANGEEPKSALQSDTDLVDAAGWNPDRWSLAGRQSGYMTMPDGHRQRVALVAHEPDVDTRAIAELLVSPIPRFEPSVSVEARTGSYCLCLADLQTGKATEARGGTSQLVARVRSIIRQAVAQAERLRPEEIVVFELGDICEGNANSTSQSQLAANDIAQAEQLQVCARLLLEAIIALAPFAPRLKVVSVRSNHGEERKNGQSIGRGDFGIMTARIIGEAISMIPGPLSERVEIVTQNALETGVQVTVSGLKIAAFHGHYAKNENKIPLWVAQQAGGTQPTAFTDARLVLHGHFHHLRIEASRGRTIIGCPSLENGSMWVERTSGEYSEPGALSLSISDGRLDAIQLLTPAEGMDVDRRTRICIKVATGSMSRTHERTMDNINMQSNDNIDDNDEIVLHKGGRFKVIGTLTPRKACAAFDLPPHDSWTNDIFMGVLAQNIVNTTGCHIVSCLGGAVAIVLQPVD